LESESEQQRETVVIAVGNQKGGVGKTTNTIQIAGALSELGRRSLIVDLDMTSGATKALRAPTEGWISSFELLTSAENAEDTIITNAEEEVPLPPNVHLVPSSRKLAELDTFLLQNPWVIHQDLLVEPIARLRGKYDYIFLDTPPQKTKTTIPALKASDYAILSAMPDHLAVSALGEALQDIATAQKRANPRLTLLGVVVCAMPRPKTRLARELVNYVERTCVDPSGHTLKFKTEITRSVVLQEAQRVGKTIFQYQGDHPVADQYRAVARELEERLRAIRTPTFGAIEETANA
jgi:chromosome partitioning protein